MSLQFKITYGIFFMHNSLFVRRKLKLYVKNMYVFLLVDFVCCHMKHHRTIEHLIWQEMDWCMPPRDKNLYPYRHITGGKIN